MDTSMIKGIIPPILTPIDDNEQVDEAKMRKQVEFVIQGGVHGILAFGSNGEFYMIEEDETKRALEIMLSQAAGRVPVYCGIGAIRTQKCIRLARMAQKAGRAGASALAGRGAVTAEAVELAEEYGMTLVGYVKEHSAIWFHDASKK